MNKEASKARKPRRTLVQCCECTQFIYTVTAHNVDNNSIRCYECCAQDSDYTAAEVEARKQDQIGPFHKKMAAYNARRA